LMYFVVQITSFGDAKQLQNPWSLYVDSKGQIIANDCGNRRLLLLTFNKQLTQFIGSADIVSVDVAELPQSFHPRRFCVGNHGKLYVGSGYEAPPETPGVTLGSVSVWNIFQDVDVNSV